MLNLKPSTERDRGAARSVLEAIALFYPEDDGYPEVAAQLELERQRADSNAQRWVRKQRSPVTEALTTRPILAALPPLMPANGNADNR